MSPLHPHPDRKQGTLKYICCGDGSVQHSEEGSSEVALKTPSAGGQCFLDDVSQHSSHPVVDS